MSALALSFLAGVLTTLSPCVLPLLPLVLASSVSGCGRFGPIAFATGLVVSFTAVGLFISTIGMALEIPSSTTRLVAAVMFVLFGLMLLVKPLGDRLAVATTGLATEAGRITGGVSQDSLAGPFFIGLLTGVVWSPCSGPSLGAAIALAAEAGGLLTAATRMLAFGLGAAVVLMLLAYGSRSAIMSRRNALMSASSWLKPVGGGVFVLVGVAVIAGLDKTIETWLVGQMPQWLTDITTQY